MAIDILRTSGYAAALAASTHAPGFHMQRKMLVSDGLIHLTVLFHGQGAVKYQVWEMELWWGYGTKLRSSNALKQVD